MVNPSRPPNHISIGWVLLDMVGMAMAGLGFAVILGKLAPGTTIPAPMLGWGLVVTGVCCMAPLLWNVRRAVRHYAKTDRAFIERMEKQRSTDSNS